MTMAASVSNTQPGRVVEAEILRRYGSSVTSDPSSAAKDFFLVLSVGRCKFRLSEHLIENLLQAVIGGSPRAFRVVQLDDRVFRFSVASYQVGFHIYNLRSFECQDFKVFFHLWHNGGPNFKVECRNWCIEQAAKWMEVSKRKSVRLTGANSVPIAIPAVRFPASSSNSMEFSKFQLPFNSRCKSIFMRLDYPINAPNYKNVPISPAGILGPIPDPRRITNGHGLLVQLCTNCLSLVHARPACNNPPRCRNCLGFGHISRKCSLPP